MPAIPADSERPRLRHFNPGAVLALREVDLLIATVFPASRGVHIVKAIIRRDGHGESASYLIPPQQPQQFSHKVFQTDSQQLETLRLALHQLAHSNQDHPIIDPHDDPHEYEEPSRRLLRYRHLDGEVRLFLPRLAFLVAQRGRVLAEEYRDRFESAWQRLLQVNPWPQ